MSWLRFSLALRALGLVGVVALAPFACDPRSEPSAVPRSASISTPPIAAPTDMAAPPLLIPTDAAPGASIDAALPARLTSDAGPSLAALLTLQQRAAFCLDDPACPASEADRLFRAADDAHEDAVDCFRFADGDGTKKDLARARACLERATATMKCEGSSADLAQAELAIYRIDGVGGPRDVSGARKLFDGCFADVTQQEVLEHAAAREADAGAPRVDFCKDYGGTTLTGNECTARTRQHEATRGALQAKSAASGLDDDGKRLFAAASLAYAVYVSAMGSYVYEVYRDGSVRNAVAMAEESALLARRTTALAKFAAFAPRATSREEIEGSSRSVDAALKARIAGAGTPDLKAKIADAHAAWTAYRDAEVALYLKAFGATTPEAVRGAVLARLNRERVGDLGK